VPETVDLTANDAPELTELYEAYEWWADRDVDGVYSCLEETDVAVGVRTGDRLVAAARVITDYRYYAMVYDVVVASDRRGEGIGATLMEGVVDHPGLTELPRLALLCRRGLVPYYESVGFELFDPEIEVPEGDTEELVRMTCEFGDEAPIDE